LEQLCIDRRRASLLRSFSLRKAELGFFHFLSLAVYLPPHKVPLAENRFLQARKARQLKIQTKNPGSGFIYRLQQEYRNLRHTTWDKVRCYCEHVRGTHGEVEKHVRNPMGI
jgi:hypothetical protein